MGMGRTPDLGKPEPIWDQIPEAIQQEIQEYVQVSTALDYELVVGWEAAGAVVGISARAVRRAVEREELPKLGGSARFSSGGCRVCWPLSWLWRYRQWRENPFTARRRAQQGAR